jgi:hypothetical protein
MSEQAQRLIRMIEERGEFVTGDDGYVVYWPNTNPCHHPEGGTTGGGGSYSAAVLRAIADELDRRNAAWDRQVQAFFEKQSK